MEQLSFDEIESTEITIEKIKMILANVETLNELKPGSFKLKDNTKQKIIVGYSILLNKTLAAKVQLSGLVFSVNKRFFTEECISGFVIYKELKNPNMFMEFKFETSESFWNSLRNALNAFVKSYIQPERFGCCHRYVECSDAKRCIAPDQLHAKGCLYRKNLESGNIFYGKNATIKNPPPAGTGEGV